MIKTILTLYRHLFRRDVERDDLSTQIRFPLSEIDYVYAFGFDFSGNARKLVIGEDGSEHIAALEPADFIDDRVAADGFGFDPTGAACGAGEGGQ